VIYTTKTVKNSVKAIGILGFGLVGRALAARLKDSGYQVLACDPATPAQAAAQALDITVAANAQALAAQCDVVLIAVLDDAALRQCADALAQSTSQHQLKIQSVISCVTASVEATQYAESVLNRLNLAFADMPLLGSSQQIAAGHALGLLGASDSVAQQWASLLAVLCPNYRHVGPCGHGARAKLACNLVLGLNRAALAEGLALATTLGLDGTAFLELLRESPAYSRAVDVAGPRMVARDFAPRSRIAQHRKDLGLMLDEAHKNGLNLSLTQAHAKLLDQAIAQGLGELDNVAIIDAIQSNTQPT
jgi:3-hydroxyisobutyrate dehydrogenase-like beta-hydroxyacid dehydrogenase